MGHVYDPSVPRIERSGAGRARKEDTTQPFAGATTSNSAIVQRLRADRPRPPEEPLATLLSTALPLLAPPGQDQEAMPDAAAVPAAIQRRPAAGTASALPHAEPSRAASLGAREDAIAHEAAERGTRGAGEPLPHLETIQRSFGRHDVRGVRAHLGSAAAESARAMGAVAFATGDRVAFAGAPDLATAAHEAAHVVQQRGGVQLKGGVGAVGDVYERHADAVASAVVRGASAEALLTPFAGAGRGERRGVQRRVVGGDIYGEAFTNTEDPDFKIFDTANAAAEYASTNAARWALSEAKEADDQGREKDARARLEEHVKAVPSDYKTPAAIDAMTLDELDTYARAQADWATGESDTGAPLFAAPQKEHYTGLLAFARAKEGRVLDACSRYHVAALLALGVGFASAPTANITAYAEGVAEHYIEEVADTLDRAIAWGEALRRLVAEPKLTREMVHKVIPQRRGAQALAMLVLRDRVGEFIDYVHARDLVLHATDGSEVFNFCDLREEGGDPNAYRALEPDLRHVHHYTKQCLDALLVHRGHGPLDIPLTIIMQSALDFNGVTYRNRHVTDLVLRPNRTTLIVESKGSLADFAAAADRLAKAHKRDGKVDEVLISGHGEFSSMDLAATKAPGRYPPVSKESIGLSSVGDRLYQALCTVKSSREAFHAVLQSCPDVPDKTALPGDPNAAFNRLIDACKRDRTVQPKLERAIADMAELPPNELTEPTEQFVARLMTIMKDDAATSRIVLHACLTSSNRVLTDIESKLPVEDQQAAIKAAIAKDPSLVTKIKERIPMKGFFRPTPKGVSVLGANASVYGDTTELKEPATGGITLRNPGDDRLTASKLEYARHGIEPEGALRAAVEAWADDAPGTIAALRERVAVRVDRTWNETLIRALYERIVADPNNGALIITLERASGALAKLVKREYASVADVRGKVPDPHVASVFTALTQADEWAQPAHWFTRAVLYQVWMDHDVAKRADFLAALTAAAAAGQADTQKLERFLDFKGVGPHLDVLLAVPGAVADIHMGPTLLALSYALEKGGGAPAAALGYLRGLLDLRERGGRQFPLEARVADMLKASTARILRAVGRGEAERGDAKRIEPHNLSVARAGRNDLTVESITRHGTTNAEAPVFDRPDGMQVDRLDDMTDVVIHGKIGRTWYAIEHGQRMGFVKQDLIEP